MKFLYLIILILAVGYITYIVVERIILGKIRSSFKYVIHVNGIRGKSTTTRLIDAGMRKCGFKVFSKTTGTVPTYINTNNEDVVIKRLGKANIKEQIKMLRKAKKEGAEVVVLECMAVNPELQKICEEKIIKADVCVITNVRLDHIGEMADDLDGIAEAFAGTIPTNGTLVINESEYVEFFTNKAQKKNSKVIVSKKNNLDSLGTFDENIDVALGVAEALGLDKDLFYEGMKEYHHDVGAYEEYKYKDMIFLNGFSINDPTSIKIVFDKIIKKYPIDKISILLNNRYDRPTRVNQHIDLLSELGIKRIYLMGSNYSYVERKLKKKNNELEIKPFKTLEDLEGEQIVFSIGNIGGNGGKVLNTIKELGEKL